MDAQAFEITKFILGSAGILGLIGAASILIFRTGKIIQKFEHMDQKIIDLDRSMDLKMDELERTMTTGFKKNDDQFKAVDARFQKLEDTIPTIKIAITRLEVRLEERTIRMIDVPKSLSSN